MIIIKIKVKIIVAFCYIVIIFAIIVLTVRFNWLITTFSLINFIAINGVAIFLGIILPIAVIKSFKIPIGIEWEFKDD